MAATGSRTLKTQHTSGAYLTGRPLRGSNPRRPTNGDLAPSASMAPAATTYIRPKRRRRHRPLEVGSPSISPPRASTFGAPEKQKGGGGATHEADPGCRRHPASRRHGATQPTLGRKRKRKRNRGVRRGSQRPRHAMTTTAPFTGAAERTGHVETTIVAPVVPGSGRTPG